MTDIIELAEKCGLKIVENLHGVKIVVAMVDNYAGHITLEELQAFSDAIRQEQIDKDAKICDALSGLDEKGLPFDDESINVAYAEDCAEAIRNQLRKEDE